MYVKITDHSHHIYMVGFSGQIREKVQPKKENKYHNQFKLWWDFNRF